MIRYTGFRGFVLALAAAAVLAASFLEAAKAQITPAKYPLFQMQMTSGAVDKISDGSIVLTDGRTVYLNELTMIRGGIPAGNKRVMVTGWSAANGNINAENIVVQK